MKYSLLIGVSLALESCLLSPWLVAQSQSPIGSTIPIATAVRTKSAGPAQSLGGPIAVPEDFSKMKIAPGFLLNSNVLDEPDLSGSLRVDDDGSVLLPLAGKVHLAGLTAAEATEKIQDAYRTGQILNNPQVSLDIAQFSPSVVTVLGEVSAPGRYQMQSSHSLLDVLSYAGGETETAGGDVQVQRIEDAKTTTQTYHYERNSQGEAISNIMLKDGDTVTVPRAGIVYVLGAVTRPGGYLMQEDGKLDVAQAISLAAGASLTAKTSDMRIIHRRPDGTYEISQFNYGKMVKGDFVPPQLQAQDILYVPVSHVKASLTSLASLVSATSSAAIYTTR